MSQEVNQSKHLPTGDTVIPLCLCKHVAPIDNDLLDYILPLGEDTTDSKVTGIYTVCLV